MITVRTNYAFGAEEKEIILMFDDYLKCTHQNDGIISLNLGPKNKNQIDDLIQYFQEAINLLKDHK